MSKSTLVKWAVAALLAAPAIPVLGNSSYSGVRTLSATTATHRKLSTSKRHRLHAIKRRHVSLSKARKHLSSRHVKGKTSLISSRKHHGSLSTTGTNSPIRVHVTHMPPTIDGIHA
jgi:hypothetical protein